MVAMVGGMIICLFSLSVLASIEKAEGIYQCNPGYRYRTFDGSCNNLANPTWGMSGTTQRRFRDPTGNLMVDYADGVGLPRGFNGHLPDPRLVSNVVVQMKSDDYVDHKRSGEHMAFGQLLAHDFIETDIHTGSDCCDDNDPNCENIDMCFPLNVPEDDPLNEPGCKNFQRAKAAKNNDCSTGFREHINKISSYIDATFLYGSDETIANELRVPNSFLLKTDPGNLLPTVEGGNCLKQASTDRCPFAGDSRAVEAPNLGLNHLVFVREHNRLSTILHQINPHWDNEKVYQETRRIIIAQVQHITYNHFLPTFLQEDTMYECKLYSKHLGFDNSYIIEIDASIRNGFGVAPYRFGHSQIMSEQSGLKPDYTTVNVHKIEDTLESPHLWQHDKGAEIKDLTRWLVTKPAEKIDRKLVDGVRNLLFRIRNPPGLDLASLNIQRGRDQGVPAYNKWREFCGLPKYQHFSDFGTQGENLSQVYRSVNDVDLFIGGLLEEGVDGSVGPTFSCVIGKQFAMLKYGDRYWYESPDSSFKFTGAQLDSIKTNTLMSKIWCRNFGLETIQQNIFLIPSDDNPLVDCDDLPDINLYLWKDRAYNSSSRKYRKINYI